MFVTRRQTRRLVLSMWIAEAGWLDDGVRFTLLGHLCTCRIHLGMCLRSRALKHEKNNMAYSSGIVLCTESSTAKARTSSLVMSMFYLSGFLELQCGGKSDTLCQRSGVMPETCARPSVREAVSRHDRVTQHVVLMAGRWWIHSHIKHSW